MPINKMVHIPKPKSWEELEVLTWDIFRAEWNDPMAVRHGRNGQRQHGVDIYGHPHQSIGIVGIQVKGKTEAYGEQLTKSEMQSEIEKAYNFEPPLHRLVFVTSAPRDANVQKIARALSDNNEAKNLFAIHVLGWEDLEDRLASHPDILRMHYPEQFGKPDSELTTLLHSILREQRQEREANLERMRPRFNLIKRGRSTDSTGVMPIFEITQSSGDPISYIKWRFVEPLRPTEFRILYSDEFSQPRQRLKSRYEIAELAPIFDRGSESVRIKIEICFDWMGESWQESHSWPLYKEKDWYVGEESLPPETVKKI